MGALASCICMCITDFNAIYWHTHNLYTEGDFIHDDMLGVEPDIAK